MQVFSVPCSGHVSVVVSNNPKVSHSTGLAAWPQASVAIGGYKEITVSFVNVLCIRMKTMTKKHSQLIQQLIV